MKQVDIFNVKIAAIDSSECKREIQNFLENEKHKKISKVNTEFLLRALKNDDFRNTLDDCDLNIADGKGVLWAAKYLSMPMVKIPFLRQIQAIWQMMYSGASLIFYPSFCKNPIPVNIPGVEAMYLMLESAAKIKSSVYFLGAMEDVNEKAVVKMKDKYPDLIVAGNKGGFWEEGEEINDINKSKAELLIVALGSPKQEYWIRDNLKKLDTVKVAVGEGGSLDFISGSFKRAPKCVQKLGLEWLWRLFMNKSKSHTGSRAKRVWQAVPVFIWEVVKFKIRKSDEKK